MTDAPPSPPPVELVPLGGLGEFGMNMMAVAWGDALIVIDAGVMFPDAELLGVDRIIPDLTWLAQHPARTKALVLTHGHEDHIGAVPHVLPLINGPIYGTPFTMALVEPKLDEYGLLDEGVRSRLKLVTPGDRVRVGEIDVEFIRVTHSIPDCVALALHTPCGVIVHTGDFKIDQTPLDGRPFDLHRLAELGRNGVAALLSDSTNIDRPGFSGSETEVVGPFEEIFTSTEGKLFVAAFASSIYRIQILVDLAARFGRKVAFVGRGVVENTQTAAELGFLKMRGAIEIRDADVSRYPNRDVLCICTGSQGEPRAALSRIAIDDHKFLRIEPGDRVVFSARAIPGNERAIGRVMNHVAKRGADIVHDGIKRVHVSGHGSEEELKLVLSLVKPAHFIPIHGEYRQLARHAQTARNVTGGRTKVLPMENGDILHIDLHGARVVGKAPAGRILIDDAETAEAGRVDEEVLRDRRHLSEDGFVAPIVAINRQNGRIEGVPEIITRGLSLDPQMEMSMREATQLLADVIESASVEERTDDGLIKEKIRSELRRFFRRRLGRRPLVLPVIMEI